MSDEKPVDPEKYPDQLAAKLFWIVILTTAAFFAAALFIFMKAL